MALQPSQTFASVKTETDVAVLQVQFQNLTDRVDEIKSELSSELQELYNAVNTNAAVTNGLIKELKQDNTASHQKLADKVASLEKWRWMIMGAGIFAGALGWPILEKLV